MGTILEMVRIFTILPSGLSTLPSLVPDELESLALITVVRAKIFGHEIGSLLVGDALRDQLNAES
jgi:hypothetical protein